MKNNQINVLICDDHQIFIDGLRQGLDKEIGINVCCQALSGEEVLAKANEVKVDVVVMDIELPNMNGIQTTRKLKALYPDIQVIALSMHDNTKIIQRMIRSGAKGYLLKNTSIKELAQAISEVFHGRQFFKGVVLNKIIEFSSGGQMVDPMELLTERELEILKFITQGKSTTDIADQLFISTHTVKSHRKNLLRKLNQKNSAGLVSFALKNNLI